MPRAVQNALLNVAIFLLVASPAIIAFAQVVTPAPSAEVKKDIEILTLKAQLTTATKQLSDLQAAIGGCQAQLGPLVLERNQGALEAEKKGIIEKYEKTNPGFTLDPSTLAPVKKPDPPVPQTPAKPKG